MTIKQAIKYVTNELENAKIEESGLKAKMLMEYCLDKDRAYIIAFSDSEISNDIYDKLIYCLEKAKKDEPIQYIIGKTNFMGYEFLVNENVLIPRQDTEILVCEVVSFIKNGIKQNPTQKEYNILDMCTGSGAIIISIAKLCQNISKDKNIKFNYYAVDISKEALNVAKENARKNDIKIKFIESDLFDSLDSREKMNLIISNPPYIKTEVINNLNNNVKKEPLIALDGGKDGDEFYKKISIAAKDFLKKYGYLFLEIGYDQKDIVEKILLENDYKDIRVVKDLSLNDRVIISRKE